MKEAKRGGLKFIGEFLFQTGWGGKRPGAVDLALLLLMEHG